MLEEIDGLDEPVVMVHDYQLYTLPGDGPARRARTRSCTTSSTSRGPSRTPGACCRRKIRDEIYHGLLANDIIGFHTRSYRRNFLQCCRDLLDLEVDMERGVVRVRGPRGLGARLPAADRLARDAGAWPSARACAEFEEKLLARRREFSILRVDRADLSKNVLRGFTGFDIFLEQHPEFAERITFTAQLMPSRTDVPEYAEYLERIEALVAVVNHRHGTPDWMPIDLKLRDDLEEAVASYKHYDVMMVNAMFDGMNLVAKEGPLVNERDGVSILSENTGAHEELGEFALSVNPFDVQELADSIYAALTMAPEERARRARGAQGDRHVARSGRLDRRADRRHPQEGARGAQRSGRSRARCDGRGVDRSKPNSRSAGSTVGRGRGRRAAPARRRGAARRARRAAAARRGPARARPRLRAPLAAVAPRAARGPASAARPARRRGARRGRRVPAAAARGAGAGARAGTGATGHAGVRRAHAAARRPAAATRRRGRPRATRARRPARRCPSARVRACPA